MPATGYVEAAMAAGSRVFDAPVEVTTLTFQPLTLPWQDPDMNVWLQTSLSDEDGVLRMASRTGDAGQPWRAHARGRVRPLVASAPQQLDIDSLRRALPRQADSAQIYERARRIGLDYGPCFRVLDHLSSDGSEAVARYRAEHLSMAGYVAHPAILDGALQAGAALLPDKDDSMFLPAAIDTIRAWRPTATTGYVHVCGRSRTAHEAVWDVTVTDDDGTVCVELLGCRVRSFDARTRSPIRSHVTELRAAPRPHTPAPTSALPCPADILTSMMTMPEVTPPEQETGRAIELTEQIKRLTAHFTVRALADIMPGGEPFTWTDLAAAGVQPEYAPLLGVLLDLAQDYGLLKGENPGRLHQLGSG